MVLKLFKDRIRNNTKKNVKSPVLGVKLVGQKQRMKSLKKIYADLNKKTRTTIWRPTVRRRTPEIPSKVGNTQTRVLREKGRRN